METIGTSDDLDAQRRRRRQVQAIKESLRALSNQLSVLNHQVSAHVELKDVDLDCLELVSRHGRSAPAPSRGAPGCTPPP
jgi:hypothetical protein